MPCHSTGPLFVDTNMKLRESVQLFWWFSAFSVFLFAAHLA
jgi:hypothetical protein